MMAIYPPRPAPFTCAICLQERPPPWQSRDHMDIPPICWSCEQDQTLRTGSYYVRNPDQRLAKQIGALAEMLQIEAYRASQNMGPLYG
ncbi:hypothetical protein [Pseudogemmobacter humi]|uniref:Uncharacterized protein n=1 Tax=Pseudogemmobacter humi TaxID=2483812 RepID=A0A3P5XBM2_9RHOB|nr:hypothetical protein [Pseudogemmobacter humi]VDC28262.1 hypothetical protein XINFAN_02037 [Pseudogemmobacter humi]